MTDNEKNAVLVLQIARDIKSTETTIGAETANTLYNLINRQKAEIERLKTELKESYGENEKLTDNIVNGVTVCAECHNKYAEKIKTAKSEAIREFAEKLKREIDMISYETGFEHQETIDTIDNLVKEMTEGNNG